MDEADSEVPDEVKALVDRVIYLRGRIVTAYAQIEFLVGDLYSAASTKFAEHVPDAKVLPCSFESRMAALVPLLEAIPDFEPYRDEIVTAFKKLPDYSMTRNFMAHGFASIERGAWSEAAVFRMYVFEGKSVVKLMEIRPSVAELEAFSNSINDLHPDGDRPSPANVSRPQAGGAVLIGIPKLHAPTATRTQTTD